MSTHHALEVASMCALEACLWVGVLCLVQHLSFPYASLVLFFRRSCCSSVAKLSSLFFRSLFSDFRSLFFVLL